MTNKFFFYGKLMDDKEQQMTKQIILVSLLDV